MRYYVDLILRLILSFSLFLVNLSLVTLPITFYSSYYFLVSLGYSVGLDAPNVLTLKDTTVNFVEACSASVAYTLLGLLILLTKGVLWKTRLRMFLYGAGIIFIVNLFRVILLLVILTEYGRDYFDAVHLFFWDVVASVLVVGVWIYLAKRYSVKEIPVISDLKELRQRSMFR